MSRYEIALQSAHEDKETAYRFPSQKTINGTVNCIQYCIDKKGVFLADRISIALLQSALVKISKKYNAMIITETDTIARSLSISFSYKYIFSLTDVCLEDLPKNKRNIIFFNCFSEKISSNYNVLVKIILKT